MNTVSWQPSDNMPLGTGMARAVMAAALLIPPLAVLAPKGLTWVALALALTLTMRDFHARALMPHWPQQFALIMLALITWSALSALWAVNPSETLSKLASLATYAVGVVALIGAGRAMTEEQRRILGRALTVGLLAAFGFLAIERSFEAPILGAFKDLSKLKGDDLYSIYNRGLGICAVLIWPAMAALWRADKRVVGLALPALLIGLAIALEAWSVLIGLCAALIGAGLVLTGSRSVTRLLGGLAVIVVLAHPFVTNWAIEHFAPANRAAISDMASVNHRLIIWEFTGAQIMNRPLLGYGFNASRSLPGGQKKFDLLLPQDSAGKIRPMPRGAALALHPHNAPLQWWLELGLPGAALGAMLLWLIYRGAGAIAAIQVRALISAQIIAGACISALAWGAWQIWWLSGLALAAWFTLAMTESGPGET